MQTCTYLKMHVYLMSLSTDEVLGLKNTNKYFQKGAKQNKELSDASNPVQASDDSLSIVCKHVTEVSAISAINGTTINLSVVREVTVHKQNNKNDGREDDEGIDITEEDLPTNLPI